MSLGTPFHERTAPLNLKLQWRDWAGYLASSAYADGHEIEYSAIRHAAALIDVSPLYKYLVRGRDAQVLIDRVVTRDASKMRVGQVIYTPWCDEAGCVIDDGTIARLDETTFRWTSADPSLRWIRMNARGLDVSVDDVSEELAALALQGPRARDVLEASTGEAFGDLRYYRRRASQVDGVAIDVSRTGYTGDLGYELWVERGSAVAVWDRLLTVGAGYALRPAGMLALDVARLEAGLILIEVDYTSARHALVSEQGYSPFEIGLGRLVDLSKPYFVGRAALVAEQLAGGPERRLVGLEIDWPPIEALFLRHGLPVAVETRAWREHRPLYSGGRQVGRATSGTWSPTLKRHIALGSLAARSAEPGTELQTEWTVEARRGRVPARVVELPFFDPPRKRA